MKATMTKTFGAILFAAASLSPMAHAGKPGNFDFPRKPFNTPRTPVAEHCYSKACAGIACCETKSVSKSAAAGKSTMIKRVRVCTSACPVPKDQHREVCRVGSRA
jgi:hypothetical protein